MLGISLVSATAWQNMKSTQVRNLKTLLERIIKASTNANELVLDPFGGTFTTCAVAQRLWPKINGIELQPGYVKIGLRRLGIASHFNGEELRAPDKTYVRKNGNGVRGDTTKE